MKRLLSMLLTATLAFSVFTGCTSGGDNKEKPSDKATESTEGATDKPKDETTESVSKDGQYLNVFMVSEPTSFDASLASDQYAGYIFNNTLEALTRFEPVGDGKAEIKPAGAESWEISEDNLTYTFHLRDNKWSDGKDVVAGDYEYALKRTMNPETGSPVSYNFTSIKNAKAIESGDMDPNELGVKALDDKTLEITLESPTPYFLSLTYQSPMAPQRQDIVEEHGDSYGSEANKTVYNGPFVATEWVHNSKIVLQKNEHYWDKDTVQLDTVTYNIISEISSYTSAFSSGEIDVMIVRLAEWVAKFEATPNVENTNYSLTQTNYIFFNAQDELMSNMNIRKAISVAIDREELSEVVFTGTSKPSYGWVPTGISVGDIDYRDAVEEPLKKIIADTEDPKALLIKGMEELGLGSDPSTLDITIDFAGTTQWFKTFAEYLQQSFKSNLGVNLKINFQEWPVFSGKTETGDYQMGYMAWGSEYNDPYAMLNLLSSSSNAIMTGWSSDEYDAILLEASTEMDDAKRLELYKKAEQILFDEAVICPVVNGKDFTFWHDYVEGVAGMPMVTSGFKYYSTAGRK